MNRFYAAFFRLGGEAEVEAGVIDCQEQIGSARVEKRGEAGEEARKKAEAFGDFPEAHHAGFGCVREKLHAFGAEAVAADAEGFDGLGDYAAEFAQKFRAVSVAAYFAGGD